MEQKDKFIVSVLNSLGFGVNAMIPKNVEMFASRMRQTINGIKVEVVKFSDETLLLEINDGFLIEYEKNESRVTSLKVLNNMKHLIDKDALVVEIEELEAEAKIYPSDFGCGRLSICKELMNFLDTLEVKDVDLE